jgi:hypothetical protein
MRRYLWLAVAMLPVGMGCPTEFGIDGRIDKAAERDMKEIVEKPCPLGTQREKFDPSCRGESCTRPRNCVPDK